jgi:hypothetical protein
MQLRPRREGEIDMIYVKTAWTGHRIATTTLWGLLALLRLVVLIAGATTLLAGNARAGLLVGTNQSDLLIGADDDNLSNPIVQPAGATNQSLSDTDVIDGRAGNDVLIGLLGNDVMRGGAGDDVLVGGTEQFTQPNSDVMYGDDGDDVAIWRPGDGSDAFIGGRGVDALVMAAIDRDGNVPRITPVTGRYEETGLPTADASGQPGFCTLEDVRGEKLGYDFLVRFFLKATGALAVTVRVADVEQVFCTSRTAAAITFADLRDASPAFVEVSQEEVRDLNDTVGQIIR